MRFARHCPRALEAVQRFLDDNVSRRDFFTTPEEIDRETQERLDRVLRPTIRVRTDEPLAIEAGGDARVDAAMPVVVSRPDPMG